MTSLTKNKLSFDVTVDRTDFGPDPDLPTAPDLPPAPGYIVEQTIIVDGITALVIWVASDGLSAIAVDKNHDLSYYFAGSDYVDTGGDSGIINAANKYGYEWGGYGIATGITATSVGTGLSNTNSLISMNLQPYTSGWYVVWDKIKEFRQSHSDNWFLPSMGELDLIHKVRSSLSNWSTSATGCPYYLSSSEHESDPKKFQYMATPRGQWFDSEKNKRSFRSRLCVKLGS